MVKSPKKKLIKEDYVRAFENALLFAGPALLVLIASTIEVIPEGAKYGAYILFLLNFITDLLKKFLEESKY